MQLEAPPARIPLTSGDEQDVFRSRHLHIWTRKPGACRRVKRGYNRRLRRVARLALGSRGDG